MAEDRALPSRNPGDRKRGRLLDAAAEITAVDPEILAFQHSIFCQVSLPYRNPGAEVREWERANGRARLMVIAGAALDPATDRWVRLRLPYHYSARFRPIPR